MGTPSKTTLEARRPFETLSKDGSRLSDFPTLGLGSPGESQCNSVLAESRSGSVIDRTIARAPSTLRCTFFGG